MKHINILIIILIILIPLLPVNAEEINEIDYTESIEEFENPERGFYQYFYYNFEPENNELPSSERLNYNLLHLRLGIGSFSQKVNGEKDEELTQDMLNTFDRILKTIKQNGGTAIIRFAYDNFDGQKNQEPSLDMILKHIEQLKPILEANQEVISYIELGFFGPWGEMHSSDICTIDNVSKAIDKMLISAPEEIKIGVRQPKYYTSWANINREEIDKNITIEGTKEYRIGLYNDGYLGSDSDLGTFQNRNIEIEWLKYQATHTFYGGEVVKYRGEGHSKNKSSYMIEESYKTHTTYLNSAYDKSVIDLWKTELYTGPNELYKNQTGYTYINNHLGYRFVLKNSKISINDDKLKINLAIENVGFANLINSKKVTIVLTNGSQNHELQTNINPQKWDSQEITNLDIELSLPNGINREEWKVYLRISEYGNLNSDNNYLCIRLANNSIWNEKLGANYIGKITIAEKKESIIIQDDTEKEKKEELIIENTTPAQKEEASNEINKESKNENAEPVNIEKEDQQLSEELITNNSVNNSQKDLIIPKYVFVIIVLIIGFIIIIM